MVFKSKEDTESYKNFMSSWFETAFYNAYGDVIHDEDIKNISRQFDYTVNDHPFFKNRDKQELAKFCKAVKNLNIIAVKTFGIICVEVNLLGNNVHVWISSDNLLIDGKLLDLFKESIEFFDELYFNNNSIMLKYDFGISKPK